MKKSPYSGKLIVFEGLDGSGKSTQAKLLAEHFKKEGFEVEKIDFPQYGTKSASLIENYLNGKYGSAKDVSPYIASIFYACDRYDASFKIKQWLKEGKFVICDRYVASNIAHQGGKIKDRKKRKRFIRWLHNLEYKLFNIPKPDICFILKTSPQLAQKMAPKVSDKEKKKKRKAYLGKSNVMDLHEKDLEHLKDALKTYLEIANDFPKEYKIINCLKKGKFLSKEFIHQQIWNIVQTQLLKNKKSSARK